MHENIEREDIQKVLAQGEKKSSFWIYFLLLFLLLSVGVFWFLSSPDREKKINYKTIYPQRKDLISTVSATGNLEPTNSVDIGIEVSGTIEDVFVNYNDKVKKGQILARLDRTKLKSQLSSVLASLKVAEAKLEESRLSMENAKRELDRVKKLFKSTDGNYPSGKEIDIATTTYYKTKASYKASLAQVEQAKAVLKTNEDNLIKAIVISPIDGIVLNKTISAGQSVVASMSIPILFTLAKDLKEMEVVVSVDEADVGEVKKGQIVNFTVDAYAGKTFEGTINQVRMNSKIVNNVVTYETVVSVDNSEQILRPGMTVSADITTKVVPNALIVPNSALRFTPPLSKEEQDRKVVLFSRRSRKKRSDLSMSGKQLWVLQKGKAREVKVKFGDSDGINTIVLDGNITTESKVIISIREVK